MKDMYIETMLTVDIGVTNEWRVLWESNQSNSKENRRVFFWWGNEHVCPRSGESGVQVNQECRWIRSTGESGVQVNQEYMYLWLNCLTVLCYTKYCIVTNMVTTSFNRAVSFLKGYTVKHFDACHNLLSQQ